MFAAVIARRARVDARNEAAQRLLVDSTRNSECSAPLRSLDWERWFTDGRSSGLYLHFWSKDGKTIHRVYCKRSDSPRLECNGGVLWWLIDAPPLGRSHWS